MKKKMKKIVVSMLSFCVCALLGMGTYLSLGKTTASASMGEGPIVVSGASLRVPVKNADETYSITPAIKFHTQLGSTYFSDNKLIDGYTTGLLIAPTSLVGTSSLTLDTYGALNAINAVTTNHWTYENGAWNANVLLTNIVKPSQYGLDLTVVAYVDNGASVTYSVQEKGYSYSYVAIAEKENPDSLLTQEQINAVVVEYATFTVTVDGTGYEILYGNKVPFAGTVTYTNAAGTATWNAESRVTKDITLVSSSVSAATLEDTEIDLDVNVDGTLNEENMIEFDISPLNVGGITFGTDYTLDSVTVGGEAIASLDGVTVSENVLKIPAANFGYVYGEQEIGLAFGWNGKTVNVSADALIVSKKISDKAELDGMNAITAQYLDSDANTYGGYFVLDADVNYNETITIYKSNVNNVWNCGFQDAAIDNIASFVGTFDGCGHTVNGLLINAVNSSTVNAFITKVGVGGAIKNVAFTNAVVSGAGSVVTAYNAGTVENVYVHVFSYGGWIQNGTGLFTAFNEGWCSSNAAIINGGAWSASGAVKNLFVDMTDSAIVNTQDATTNSNYGKTWHDDANVEDESSYSIKLLGKPATGVVYDGVYVVGVPENLTRIVHGLSENDKLARYIDEAAFDAAYGATGSALKAEIDTWPVWMRELIPVDIPIEILEEQKIDLDMQVNDGVVSLNKTATATFDLSQVGEISEIKELTMGGVEIEEATLSGSTLTIPVAQFGYAYGEKNILIVTELEKIIIPVVLVSKTIKTVEDINEFGYIAKACESDTKTWGGYFELGNDIDYNAAYTGFINPTSNASKTVTGAALSWAYAPGFIGTFDGCGYTIDGLQVNALEHAFIGVLGDGGVIKNVAFTNAVTKAGFVTAGGKSGLIENVYVQVQKYSSSNGALGTYEGSDGVGIFFNQPNGGDSGISLKNCFVDATVATVGSNNDSTLYINAGAIAGMGNKDNTTGNYTGTFTNVYAVVRTDGKLQGVRDFTTGQTLAAADYETYAGASEFVTAYMADETANGLKATFDLLNEMFAIELNNAVPVAYTVERQEINLDVSVVDGVATVGASATVDLGEQASALTAVTSLAYGETAIEGASVNGSALTLPLSSFAVSTYGEGENLVLVATEAGGKQHTITVPTDFITKIITTKDELDSFSSIAAAVATAENTWDGYFKLGANITYNDNLLERTASGDLSKIPSKWNSSWATPTTTNGFVGTFDGQGYAIDGLLVYDGGFIPSLATDGVLKNIAFTNALIGSKGTIVGYNNGLMENIYVHVYAYGIYWGHGGTVDAPTWCSYTYYNPGTAGSNMGVVNNTAWDATGTVRNMFVDMTESAKTMQIETKDWTGWSWLDHADYVQADGSTKEVNSIRIFGLGAAEGVYEGVYAVGVPTEDTEFIQFVTKVPETELFTRFADHEAYAKACQENETMQAWAATLDGSFWKSMNGAPTYKYASTGLLLGEVNADLSLNSDKTAVSTVARGSIVLSDVNTEFGELEYVQYNGVDLNGEYADGVLTFDMSGFGTAFGEQKITIKFKEGVAFNEKVFVISKVLYNADDLNDFEYISILVGNALHGRTDGMISDGYFTLGQDIAYNGTFVAAQARGSGSPLAWDVGTGAGFAGVFDGCGYTIDGMTAGTGYRGTTISGYGAFISVLHEDGIIRNVGFTNATVSNSGSVGGFLVGVGQGLIENVYVEMTGMDAYVAGVIFGTDNIRGANGPTVRNVLVDTTALTTTKSTFYALGGNVNDKDADGVVDPFGIYENAYAVVNNATQQAKAFGAGGAYSATNTGAYTGMEAFGEAYWNDAAMKATVDQLNELFGLGLNFEAYKSFEIALTESQDLDLNVASDLTIAENVTVDLSEIQDDLGSLESATLTSGASAYALRSASTPLTGASISGSTLTIPTGDNFDASVYGEYTLTVETSNRYTITLPVSIVSNVITTKEELDSFGEIALAIGGGNGVYDGYFKLGNDIDYNATITAGKSGNIWTPWFTVTYMVNGDYASFNDVTGFKGIFDGDGYAIHGWYSYNSSGLISGFITKVAEEGVIRNVAFTDVVNAGASSVITAENNGLIENVYVHYYAYGVWINASGYFTEFNSGWTGGYTATFNGGSKNATGTIRNVIVDMTESAKPDYTDSSDNFNYGLTWHYDAAEVYPLGKAENATYEGVYAIGIPDECTHVMANAISRDHFGWYNDAAEAMATYYASADVQSIVNALDTSFWKITNGVPTYKYASALTATEINLDLVLSEDKASAAPANATVDFNVGKGLGTLTSATFNGTDLGGSYNAETGAVTVNTAAFGYAYGDQKVSLTFTDDAGAAHTFDFAVSLVTKILTTKDDLTNFGYLSKLCESDTKTWGGYFKLGNDIDYGKTSYVGFINPSSAAAQTLTGEGLGWGWKTGFIGTFDGCGYTIDQIYFLGESHCRSFISVLGEGGVIRNVAFTNVRKGGTGGIVSSGGFGGVIENVYVHVDIFGANSGGANDSWLNADGMGVFFSCPNGDVGTVLKNCFVDASAAQVGATNTLFDYVGAIGSLGKTNDTTRVYSGTMTGVYFVSDASGNIQPVRDTNTTDATLANVTGITTHNGTTAFLAAYDGTTQTREDIKAFPEWMKALIFGEANRQPAAISEFTNSGYTDYEIVLGSKDASEAVYSAKADKEIGKAWKFLTAQVQTATGAKLPTTRVSADEWTNEQKLIVLADWALFNQSGLSLDGAGYGVFLSGNTVFIMAENAEDYQPAILKFLELAIGYRAYSASSSGSSTSVKLTGSTDSNKVNTYTDGALAYDNEFTGFTEYVNVTSGTVATLSFADYTNTTVFEHRQSGAHNLSTEDQKYGMGVRDFNGLYGSWHNTFEYVDPTQEYTVNGNTYGTWASTTETVSVTDDTYYANSSWNPSKFTYTYKTSSHPWFATATELTYTLTCYEGALFGTQVKKDFVVTGTNLVIDNTLYNNADDVTEPYQLCYTAHGNSTAYTDLVSLVGDQMIATANEHPEYEIFTFTQQDNYWACQCATCTAKGLPSDTVLAFIDSLEAYVNGSANLTRSAIKIAYFAYNATLGAPTSYDYDANTDGQQLNPNTYLVLAPSAYYDEAMNSGTNSTDGAWVSKSGNSEWNADWSDVEKWLTLTNGSNVNVYLWTYELNQQCWFISRNSFSAMLENYALFANYDNIDVFYTENLHHNANVSAFGQLKAYMNSKAMMEPDKVSYDTLVNEFFSGNANGTFTDGKGYYGAAGQYMYNLYTEMVARITAFDENGTEFGRGGAAVESLTWDQTDLNNWVGYLNSAYDAVKGTVYEEHVLIESMMVRWIIAYSGSTSTTAKYTVPSTLLGVSYSNITEFRTQLLKDARAFGYLYYASGKTPTMYALETVWLSSNTIYTTAPETYY